MKVLGECFEIAHFDSNVDKKWRAACQKYLCTDGRKAGRRARRAADGPAAQDGFHFSHRLRGFLAVKTFGRVE